MLPKLTFTFKHFAIIESLDKALEKEGIQKMSSNLRLGKVT